MVLDREVKVVLMEEQERDKTWEQVQPQKRNENISLDNISTYTSLNYRPILFHLPCHSSLVNSPTTFVISLCNY